MYFVQETHKSFCRHGMTLTDEILWSHENNFVCALAGPSSAWPRFCTEKLSYLFEMLETTVGR